MSSGTCKGCGRPIVWAKWETSQKNVPLDPEPSEKGNVLRETRGLDSYGKPAFIAHLYSAEERKALPNNTKFYCVHYVTCPQASKFRRRK